jgi:hypothetical protein
MKIKVAPGTEKYLKFARTKLQLLVDFREANRLPTAVKYYQPEIGTFIHLKASEWGDSIRITGRDTLRYFYITELRSSLVPTFANVVTSFSSTHVAQSYTATLNGSIVSTGSGTLDISSTGTYPITGVQTQTHDNYHTGAGLSGNFIFGDTVTTCLSTICFTDSSGLTAVPVTLSPMWITALAAANTLNSSIQEQYFTEGLLDPTVLAAAESGHPLVTPPMPSVFAENETIIFCRLEYTYNLGEVGSFPTTGALITSVQLVSAKKYRYSDGSWSYVQDMTVSGTTSHACDTFFGNAVFISEKAHTGEGTSTHQLETEYANQVEALSGEIEDPFDQDDLFRLIRDALY